MSARPTDEQLEDFSETGFHGCLMPDVDDAWESGEEEDDE